MSRSRRAWARLLVSYITGIQLVAIFFTGRPSFTAQTLLDVAVIPVLQAAALSVAGTSPSFFLTWCVCAVMQIVVPTVVGLTIFRNLPLTLAVVVTMLFVPVGQAAALTLSTATVRSLMAAVRRIGDAPLARPVPWMDLLIIPAGLVWLKHPGIGLAAAGLLQRRWMATKLIAAATALLYTALRTSAQDPKAAGRTVRVAAALAVALVGLNEFTPWMLNAGYYVPAPLSGQPIMVIWLELYAISLTAVVLLIRACARKLRADAPATAVALEGGAVAIFLAALALLVNGFLSLQPVAPWAGIALVFGTMGSTLLAVGALAAIPRK